MRDIKFKAWMSESKVMLDAVDLNLLCILNGGTGIDEATIILQYTGVNTKDMVEIYEGDIIRLPSYPHKGFDNYIVDGYGGAFTILDYRSENEKYDDYEGDYGYHHGELLSDNLFHLEIIGNIYENKELLDAQDN